MRAARDPEGRRRAIVEAAVRVVARVGTTRATHRLIADEAGVPLGSTTYYFPTLADLLSEALESWAQTVRADVRRWGDALADATDLPRAVAAYAAAWLADRDRALHDFELYLLAARDPRLRPSARVWIEGVRGVLAPLTGELTAATVVELLDGVLLQALVTGGELDTDRLAASIASLLSPAAGSRRA